MRLLSFKKGNQLGLAVLSNGNWVDVSASGLPADMVQLLQSAHWQAEVQQALDRGTPLNLAAVEFLPPFRTPEKILCVGLNYVDHVAESPYKQPNYPTFFARFASTLVAHDAPIIKPRVSDEFDYEGELVAVIGKAGRHISVKDALNHVAGYTIFNEASVRDYQFKAPQWTPGKNFDGTGACGPWFVTADELPRGAKGLKLTTRVNGKVEQSASTDDMIFDVATQISLASEFCTLQPGDLIVTGTPAGVGFGKKPPVYLKAGDVCEVEIEQIGVLRNPVAAER
mgnify:FL=1